MTNKREHLKQAGNRTFVLVVGSAQILISIAVFIGENALVARWIQWGRDRGLSPADETVVSGLLVLSSGCFFVLGAITMLVGLADGIRQGWKDLTKGSP